MTNKTIITHISVSTDTVDGLKGLSRTLDLDVSKLVRGMFLKATPTIITKVAKHPKGAGKQKRISIRFSAEDKVFIDEFCDTLDITIHQAVFALYKNMNKRHYNNIVKLYR